MRGNFPLQTASQVNYSLGLHSLAAEVGIDWDRAQQFITWDGHWKNNVPVINKSYEGRVSLISDMLPNGTAIITFKTFKHGGKTVTWKSDEKYNLDSDPLLERKRLQSTKHAENVAKSKAELNQQYISAWKACSELATAFPYLRRKGIYDPNLKIMTEKNGLEFLAVPLINNGQIVGLQRIYQDGHKKLTPGATLTGSYYLLGAASLHDITKVYIAEGWATAKTIYELTGIPTVCAFSADNLKNIANMIMQYTGVKNITIAADNDQFKNGNAGLLKALEINYNLKIKVRFPNFKGIDKSSKPTDFNDLFLIAGAKETVRQLTKSKKSILRSAPNALEYRLKKLSFSPVITSANNKLLRSTIAQAMKKGFSSDEIIALLNKFASKKFSKDLLIKAIFNVRRTIERRVSKCHQINPKKHASAQFINLPLNRAEHGGYLIDESFYNTIKGFNGIVIVKSPMGSGKTEQIISKALSHAQKACYITHRISLTEEGSGRLGIDSYRDVSSIDMYNLKKLGCCINSLNSNKFQQGDWFLDCDVVAIDEGTKVLSHLSGNTVDDPEAVANTFLCAINSSKQTIICDADANDTLVELLENLTDKKILVAQSSPKLDHIDVTLSNVWDGFSKLFEDAQNGKTVLCACDSKNDVKKIKRKLSKKGLKVLGIHSESKADPDVSVVSDHFDVQIGIFRGIISPQTVMQMMGRNRTAREWFIACSPIVSCLFGDDSETRYKALAASAMKINMDEKVVGIPQKTTFDSIKLAMTCEDIKGKQDYFLTLATMLSQKGYKLNIKKTEEDHIKELKKDLAILGDEIKNEFVSLILNATTPQPHRYRKLKQAYATSEDELAEIIRYEIRHNLGTYSISEDDVLFWIENHDRRELWFEILRSERDKLLAYDKWEADQVESLTRRKHLVVKADIIQTLFNILGLDKDTGAGSFTHKNCSKFIDYLQANKNRLGAFNQYKMGPHLFENCKPGYPTRFVIKCLEKLGLKTTSFLTGKKRLASHSIDARSWQVMTNYHIKRQEMDLDISSIPKNNAQANNLNQSNNEPSSLINEVNIECSPPILGRGIGVINSAISN